jgi:hypothetical protein
VLVNIGMAGKTLLSGEGREGITESAAVIRGLGSGIVSNVFDFITNSNFKGEPVRDTNWQIAQRLMLNFIPFSSEEALGGEIFNKGVGSGLPGLLGEIAGVKSSQVTAYEELNELRYNSGVDLGFGMRDYYTLNAFEKVEVNENPNFVEDIERAKEEVAKTRRERKSEYQAYLDMVADINLSFTTRMDSLGIIPVNGEEIKRQGLSWDGKNARNQIARFQRDRSIKINSARAQFKDALDAFADIEPETVVDKAVSDYINSIYNEKSPLEDPITGEYDYEERERRIGFLREKEQYGDELIDAVEEYLQNNDHPLQEKLREDRKVLEDYWDVTDKAMEHHKVPQDIQDLWDNAAYNHKPAIMQEIIDQATKGSEGHMRFLVAHKDAAAHKRILRDGRDAQGNFVWPKIREALLRWGYDIWDWEQIANGDFLEISSPGIE